MTIHGEAARVPALRPALLPVGACSGKPCVLPDAARGMGLFACATRGSGKSRQIGRSIAYSDFVRQVPLVIIDPVGGTIDNFLDKIGRQKLQKRTELFERVHYVDMNGAAGRVIPWPIFYEAAEGERYSSRAQRFIDVCARTDPALREKPILGINALAWVAKAAGIVLCALGLGITEMWSLVTDPAAWEDKLQTVEGEYPEAVSRLRELGAMSPRDRDMQTSALRAKLSLFQLDDNYRAMFGATTPGINWSEIVVKKQAVLLDFRHIRNEELKRFCLLWVYHSFLTFVKDRGQGHMNKPISFIIDELSFLLGSAEDQLLTGDLKELVHRIARSHGIWLTLATQELFELPPEVRQTVLSLGTLIFGQTSNPKAAEELAKRFIPYDPLKVKKRRFKYGQETKSGRGWRETRPVITGEETTEFSMAEQVYDNSQVFLKLEKYHFLIGQSLREGELPTALRPFTTEHMDAGEFQYPAVTDPLLLELMRRDGVPEQKIIREIRERLIPVVAQRPSKSSGGSATPQNPRPRKPVRQSS